VYRKAGKLTKASLVNARAPRAQLLLRWPRIAQLH